MSRYIIQRLIHLVPVLFFMSVIVFTFIHLVPGDPVDALLDLEASAEEREQMLVEMGLDKSIFTQYMIWIGNVVTGDFGKSVITHQPVLETIIDKAGATAVLAGAAMIVSLLISIFAGCFAAINRGTWKDFGVLLLSLIGVSIPSFWLALILISAFSLYWPIFPAIGYVSIFDDFGSAIHHLILPAIAIGAVRAGAVARMTRSEMVEQLSRDHITTAWAKGLSPGEVYVKHALRNSLITVVTFTGLQLAHLLSGVVIIEVIFTWPGLGTLIIDSIFQRDYPMVQGTILFMAIVYVLINLLVDLSYTFLDPRIRLEKKS